MLDYYKFKVIQELFISGQDADAKKELAALQKKYVAICDANTTLKMQLQEYEDILYLAKNLIFDRGFYWLITGNIKQGPFCPDCYTQDGLLMRLAGEHEERYCPSCRAHFPDSPLPQILAANHAHSSPMQLPELTDSQKAQRATIIPFSR